MSLVARDDSADIDTCMSSTSCIKQSSVFVSCASLAPFLRRSDVALLLLPLLLVALALELWENLLDFLLLMPGGMGVV